jgi:hypothetical protein
VKAEFLAEQTIVFGWVSSVDACRIDDEKKDGASFDVPEEIMAKTFALVRSFDQSWNIGKSESGFFR